jgi:hypothetical protein
MDLSVFQGMRTCAGQKCPSPRTAIKINKPNTMIKLKLTAAAFNFFF